MTDRNIRFTIPAVFFVIFSIITICLVGRPVCGTTIWDQIFQLAKDKDNIISTLLAILITNFGIGYLCHALFTYYFFYVSIETRIISLPRFCKAFDLPYPKQRSHCIVRALACLGRLIMSLLLGCGERRNKLVDALLAEFHTRFFSHAPERLQDHCAHRNTGCYIAQTSAISVALAWIFGIGFVCWRKEYDLYIVRIFIALALMLIVFRILWRVGDRWNREFWDVAWKWIAWDTYTNKPPESWLNEMKKLIPKENRKATGSHDE